MKKRRVFDIDLPEEDFPAAAESTAPAGRRSPMAAAITETAESLQGRRAVEDSIRAENDALAAEHVRMKRLGLIVDLIDLDSIECSKLVRDRGQGADAELEELVASIRDIGLSNPIRVELRDDGRYELVQGFRRLAAYRQLRAEAGGDDRFGKIPAGILPRGEDLEGLYRRMVDENLVRKDISFAEMAQLAISYARDPLTQESDPDRAVAELFKSAGYQKRSYIRQFIRLMAQLGDDLRHAPLIPRALGLRLAAVLESSPERGAQLRAVLQNWGPRSAEEELEVLRKAAGEVKEGRGDGVPSRDAPSPKPGAKAKTVFQVSSPSGVARCTAANGRLEIRLDQDFSALDRRKLEVALGRLLADIS